MQAVQGLQTFRSEHRELLSNLRGIRAIAEGGLEREGTVAWTAQLRGELHTLLPVLERHFKGEEQGAYTAVEAERPTWTRQLESLRTEHQDLLEGLHDIVDRALRPVEPTLYSSLCAAILRWLDRLAAHERRETEIFQQAIAYDMGAND